MNNYQLIDGRYKGENGFLQAESSQTSQGNHRVAILLPTFCEAENIESLIREIQDLKLNCFILVVDDSSPDGTISKVRKLQKEYDNILLYVRPSKLGLGTAITDGFQLILSSDNPPDYIITMDADFSHNPKDIPKLIQTAQNDYDLVVGSRYCEEGKIVGWSLMRRLISRIASFIASTTVGMQVRDCTSGLRCYSINYVRNVLGFLHSQTYEIQIETLRQACLQNFKVKEAPVTFTNRKRGKSKLTLDEIRAFLIYILKAKVKKLGRPENSRPAFTSRL
ncbi:MAG: polyprenol monophosphomannose synthase [Thermoproteota archaeon]|nr:polyprenol monophosphomannose synthase [Thermoproteota archaeon]